MATATTYNKGIHAQLTLSDFTTTDKPLVAGAWNNIGYRQVGITEEFGLGFGQNTGFNDSDGRVYGKFLDTDGNVLEGEAKYVVEDTQGNTILALPWNMTLDYIGNGENQLRDRVGMDFKELVITRERRITLYIKPIAVGAAGLLDYSASKFVMSMTRHSI
jgi:hypothetical protein